MEKWFGAGSMFNFFSVLARNMTRTDALFHAGIAALLILGVTSGTSYSDMLWSSWNRGVGFKFLLAVLLLALSTPEKCPHYRKAWLGHHVLGKCKTEGWSSSLVIFVISPSLLKFGSIDTSCALACS